MDKNNHKYMSGVKRTKDRVSETQEIFTPTHIVNEILDQYPDTLFKNPEECFLDPSCGDGQFLAEVLHRKLANMTHENALESIYGVDIMKDNIELCRNRLIGNNENLRPIVERNILVGNMLDPLKKIEGQTIQDHLRMKELYYKSKAEKDAEKLRSTGLFE